MNIKYINFYRVALISLLISGCAASQHAQNLSKEILIQVVEYDNAVQGMSRALKDNFASRSEKNQKVLFVLQKAEIESITDRLAVDAVEHVVLRGFLTSDLQNFINSVLEAKRAKELQYETALASYYAKHHALLNKLTLKQDELKTVKSNLNSLQNPVSAQEQIQRLIPLIQAAYEEQKKLSETQIVTPIN